MPPMTRAFVRHAASISRVESATVSTSGQSPICVNA